MKPFMTKQTALKVGLFAVLAANVSFEPFNQAMNQIDLAQVADRGTQVEGAQPGASASAPAANKTSQPAEKKAATETSNRRLKFHDTMPVCNHPNDPEDIYDLYYYEEVQDGKTKSILVAKNDSVRIEIPRRAKLDAESKDDLLKALRNRLNCKRVAKTKNETETKTEKNKSREARRDDDDRDNGRDGRNDGNAEEEITEKEAARLVKECRIKKVPGAKYKYDEIKGKDQLECFVDRLGELADDRELAGKSGKKLTSAIEEYTKTKILKPLKKLLSSKDEDEIEEGKDLADSAIHSLKDLKYEDGVEDARIERLITTIKVYKLGGDTVKRAHSFKDDVDGMKERLRTARQDQNDRPNDWNTILQMYEVLADYADLSNQITYDMLNGPYARLRNDRGYLLPGDYNDFTSPYQSLRQDMIDLIGNGNGRGIYQNGGLFSLGREATDVRRGVSSGYMNSFLRGRNLPYELPSQAPRLNFNNLRDYGVNPVFTNPFNNSQRPLTYNGISPAGVRTPPANRALGRN